MGSVLSTNEACMVWCGTEDDAYPEPPVLNDNAATLSLPEDVALGTEVRLGPAY